MSLIRVVRSAAATLTRSLYVDETLTSASGSVTVSVTRPDGTVVVSGTASNPSVGVYTYTIPGGPTAPGSATWQLDHLTVTWTGSLGGATVALSDRVEVVGGFLFGLAEARASDASLADPVRYTTATLADKRIEVEQECEHLCGWAWVPRFARATLSGDGSDVLMLPHQQIRSLRAISTITSGVTTVVTPLTDIKASVGGIIYRHDGGYFPYGTGNVIVEYEHGHDQPPEDLKEAAMMRLRSRLNLSRSGVPDRVSSYSTPDGSVYRVTLPTRGSTGIPEVDAVYQRHEAPPIGFA